MFRAEVELLANRGHEVFIWTANNTSIEQLPKIKLALQTIWNKESYYSLREKIRATKADIVHFHNTFPIISPSGYDAARDEGVAVVQTLHNFRLFCLNAYFFRGNQVCQDCVGQKIPWPGVIHKCYRDKTVDSLGVASLLCFHRVRQTWKRRVNQYIALTEFSRQKFIEGGLHADSISVKPNFLEADSVHEQLNGEYFLFAGRLSPEKGLQILLQAATEIRGIPIYIAGDGSERVKLKAIRAEKQLENIHFLGQQSRAQMMNLYLKASAILVPSLWYEHFPMVILEAFASGRPVIFSKHGSLQEIATDGETGLGFKVGDSLDLAEKMRWAWSHPREMLNMGSAGRSVLDQKYSAESNYSQLVQIYQHAMRKS